MDTMIKKNMYLLANKVVHESRLFTNPQIKYVFIKNERKPQFVIGVRDDIDEIECIFHTSQANEPTLLEDLTYNHPIFSQETEVCEEGYLLSLMDEGYEPIFIDIQSHANLWDFIDYYMDILDSKEDTITKYIDYCALSGINPTLLSEYSDLIINDLYDVYIKEDQMIFCFNKDGDYIFLNHHDNEYIVESVNDSEEKTYPTFKEAFQNFLNLSIEDIAFRHIIEKDVSEAIERLGEKTHE